MDSPLDEALRRAARAVEVYEVPERIIALAVDGLVRMPAAERSVLQMRTLSDAALRVAEVHQHECLAANCTSATRSANSLAVVLAATRAEVDTTFGLRLTRNPPGKIA